jgi:hypothetical protein
LAVAFLGSACVEHGTDLEGTVIVPASVQALFSAEHPGQLVVIARPPQHAELRDELRVFCAASDGERRISVRTFEFGCAPEATVQVSAFAVPRSVAHVDCTGAGVLLDNDKLRSSGHVFDPAAALATATVDAPISRSGIGNCQDGHIQFTATLTPVK